MTTQTQTSAPATKPANGAKPPVATAPASASAPVAAKTDAPKADAPKADADEGDEEGKTRQARKVYIVSGTVREFKNIAEAEKHLNSDEAPKDFAVIRGLKVEQKQKVSLR